MTGTVTKGKETEILLADPPPHPHPHPHPHQPHPDEPTRIGGGTGDAKGTRKEISIFATEQFAGVSEHTS